MAKRKKSMRRTSHKSTKRSHKSRPAQKHKQRITKKRTKKNYKVARIAGVGQFRLNGTTLKKLIDIDNILLKIIEGKGQNSSTDREFKEKLGEMISLVTRKGNKIDDKDMVPSDFIVPDEGMSIEEAKELLSGELLIPVYE